MFQNIHNGFVKHGGLERLEDLMLTTRATPLTASTFYSCPLELYYQTVAVK